MADISKIKLPNGNTYDIKDIIARERGLPAGGNAGQVLSKIDGTDYNTEWIDPPSGGGSGSVNTDIVKKYTATLTSSQYAWFTFVDENGNTLRPKDGIPLFASALVDNDWYWTGFFWQDGDEETGSYVFRIGNLNTTPLSIRTSSSTLTFHLAYMPRKIAVPETAVIYSNEERVVGVWTDNKPLYQKNIYIGTLTYDTSWHLIPHNISNLGEVVKVYGRFKYLGDGMWYEFPSTRPNQTTSVCVGCNTTNIQYMNNWLPDAENASITLQYTKTTDTPGSGPYVTSGSYAHHYSTDEQVVGTWIDGSTLYEKTYTYSFTASSNDYDYTIATLSSEIKPQSIETNAFYRDGILFKELIYPPGGIYCRYAIVNNALKIRAFNSSESTFEGTVTIRYTKTS